MRQYDVLVAKCEIECFDSYKERVVFQRVKRYIQIFILIYVELVRRSEWKIRNKLVLMQSRNRDRIYR